MKLKMNSSGASLLLVLIVLLLLTISVAFLAKTVLSHTRGRKAQAAYAVNFDRSDAASAAAMAYLDTLNSPPEWNSIDTPGCKDPCNMRVRTIREAEAVELDTDSFFALDDNGDGEADESDSSFYLILALGESSTGNCTQNDGYGVECWRTHSYLILSRSYGPNESIVQLKREFKRAFYY